MQKINGRLLINHVIHDLYCTLTPINQFGVSIDLSVHENVASIMAKVTLSYGFFGTGYLNSYGFTRGVAVPVFLKKFYRLPTDSSSLQEVFNLTLAGVTNEVGEDNFEPTRFDCAGVLDDFKLFR